jgi:hypothetical protein
MDEYDFSLTGPKKCAGGSRKNKLISKRNKKANKSEVSIYNSKHIRKMESIIEKKQLNNKSV